MAQSSAVCKENKLEPNKTASDYGVFLPSPMKFSSSYSLVDTEDFDNQEGKNGRQNGRNLRDIWAAFCDKTSAHGIPHIPASQSLNGKICWTLVFLICSVAFTVQTYWTVVRYLGYQKIVEMEIIFEAAPFPAVTVCNLNAYKMSEVMKIDQLRASESLWSETVCTHCSPSGSCPYPNSIATSLVEDEAQQPCLCQSVSKLCVSLETDVSEIETFKPDEYVTHKYLLTTDSVPVTTTPSPEVIAAMGATGFTDSVAITVKTTEDIMFIVTSLDEKVRRNLSYATEEFVARCSFNGYPCDIEKSFRVHLDPIYGNCFTYNFNTSSNMYNSRAGPMYGLRLMLNVNQSDYMPTTEGAGVRLLVHNQTQFPFPDTFGYSAPTGAISSFGVRSRILERFKTPYSDCRDRLLAKVPSYLYDAEYSTEGCFRSCFQALLLRTCGCGDPRFPVPQGYETCPAHNRDKRVCLDNVTNTIGDFYRIKDGCQCIQPCLENFYEVTFSQSSWPSDNFLVGNFGNVCREEANGTCQEYFRKHTAFVEVYYEQLNYEYLRENAAYDISSLLADFGGNIGLWIGFSAITFVEFFLLFIDLAVYFTQRRPKTKKKAARVNQAQSNALSQPKIIKTATFESDLDVTTSSL